MAGREIWMPIAFGALGVLVGWIYFHLMQYSLRHLDKSPRGIGQFVLFMIIRVGIFTGVVLAALWASQWSLLTFVLAFVIARSVIVGRARAARRLASSEEKKDGQ